MDQNCGSFLANWGQKPDSQISGTLVTGVLPFTNPLGLPRKSTAELYAKNLKNYEISTP